MNQSSRHLEEATFSVKAGSTWRRFAIHDLPPQQRQRVETEADLGTIEAQLGGEFTGWAHRPGTLYWDKAQFRSADTALTSRPEAAEVWPIPDCPRFDIAGTWQGTDGTEMQLHQRGRVPRGFVRGGALSTFPNPVSGTFDGKTFSGTLDHRAARTLSSGTFTLTLSEAGRLEGQWTLTDGEMKGTSGTWSLARIGPRLPTPPRRE
jgi:hypothetical protein